MIITQNCLYLSLVARSLSLLTSLDFRFSFYFYSNVISYPIVAGDYFSVAWETDIQMLCAIFMQPLLDRQAND